MFYAIDNHAKPPLHTHKQSFFSSLTPPQSSIHTGIEHKKGYKTKRVLKKNLSTLMRFKMGLNQRPPD